MKIGILTQPLRSNYGGLLQTYALQEILKRMGCEPWIIQREKMGGEVTVITAIPLQFLVLCWLLTTSLIPSGYWVLK